MINGKKIFKVISANLTKQVFLYEIIKYKLLKIMLVCSITKLVK